MTPTPTELNQTSDDSLFAIVDASALLVVASANQAAPLAPYFTLELLRRVHERVVALKQAGQTTAAKHLLLGRAILSLIGMPIPPDDRDVDKIGNHLDVWLKRRYIDVDKKLVKNVKNIDVKKEKRLALQAQCCTITSWGGVAECSSMPMSDITLQRSNDGNKAANARMPYVPYTKTSVAMEVSALELKSEVNRARDMAQRVQLPSCSVRQRDRSEAAKRRCESIAAEATAAKRLVSLTKTEMSNAEKAAAEELRRMASEQRHERARMQREAAKALRDAQATVYRLGGQVAVAMQEVAAHAKREEEARLLLTFERERAEAEASELKREAAELRAEHSRKQRESVKALKEAEARVLRLGGQVAAAAQEAALHSQREEGVRQQLEQEQERAEAEAERCRHESALVSAEYSRNRRESVKALKEAESKALRLGCHVAAAAQEAALHAQREEEMRMRLEQEQERAEAQLQELRQKCAQVRSEHLRTERASMSSIKEAEAKLLRLGGQVASAMQEAAMCAQREEEAR